MGQYRVQSDPRGRVMVAESVDVENYGFELCRRYLGECLRCKSNVGRNIIDGSEIKMYAAEIRVVSEVH
jgi:hypothetical protein